MESIGDNTLSEYRQIEAKIFGDKIQIWGKNQRSGNIYGEYYEIKYI